jgi:hypothetical protein
MVGKNPMNGVQVLLDEISQSSLRSSFEMTVTPMPIGVTVISPKKT